MTEPKPAAQVIRAAIINSIEEAPGMTPEMAIVIMDSVGPALFGDPAVIPYVLDYMNSTAELEGTVLADTLSAFRRLQEAVKTASRRGCFVGAPPRVQEMFYEVMAALEACQG